MKAKVLKAVQTISYTSGIKVFYEEVKEEVKGKIKRVSKDNIVPALYGIYDLSNFYYSKRKETNGKRINN